MADRAFNHFMKRTLAPVRMLSENQEQIERMRNAHNVEDYTDGDLLCLLRAAMLKEGVKPLGAADNIHAHLVERVARREAAARGGCNG